MAGLTWDFGGPPEVRRLGIPIGALEDINRQFLLKGTSAALSVAVLPFSGAYKVTIVVKDAAGQRLAELVAMVAEAMWWSDGVDLWGYVLHNAVLERAGG